MDRLETLSRNGLQRTVVLFLSAFPVVFIQGFLNMFTTDSMIVIILRTYALPSIILFLVGGAFINIFTAQKKQKRFEEEFANQPFSLRDKVMIYELSPRGIYFNPYNKSQHEDMILIPWNTMVKCTVEPLRYPGIHENTDKRRFIRQEISRVQTIHPAFEFTGRIMHDEYFMLVCRESSPHTQHHSYLPIPSEWSQDEIIRFIKSVSRYIPDITFEEPEKAIHLEDVVKDVWGHITKQDKR